MTEADFSAAFRALTGNAPFPWQRALYEQFISDRPDNIPASCNLPTGLGKTSVVAVWLLALATHGAKLPRRLVYVVNRRTVVDQTTAEAEKYRENAAAAGITPPAISTLRGQFADNRLWSADPSCPAIVVGTVDMIGSRLLFSGYGCGYRTRPLHAGFLGQDALLVHDEAHLEPAFQELLLAIEREQARCRDFAPLRVMELSATSRGSGTPFELTDAEKNPPAELPEPTEPIHHVWRRLRARKRLKFKEAKRDAVAKTIGETARDRWRDSGKAVLVFVRTIDDVRTVHQALTAKTVGVKADQVETLTGTLRGKERDALAATNPVFARFMPDPKVRVKEGTVYLVCTSAGEVGVDISADHMVSDLTPLDSMAQRFGRVNRRGSGDAEIDVVYEADTDPKKKDDPLEKARWKSKEALERLPPCVGDESRHDASPLALRKLPLTPDQRKAAYTPTPTILDTSDILFDAWALTSVRGKLPGRPHVEPYLHGLAEWEPAETHVAWREEVVRITDDLRPTYKPEDLLEVYPLKPHELLREPSYRAFKHFEARAKKHPDAPVWLVDDDDKVEVLTLRELADKDEKERIEGKTVLLPPSAGGLDKGMLDGSSDTADDVADDWGAFRGEKRVRVWDDDPVPDTMRSVRTIDTKPDADEAEDEGGGRRYWRWFEAVAVGDTDGSRSNKLPVLWKTHTCDVVTHTKKIVANLPLTEAMKAAFVVAAELHDLGKRRRVFQRMLGNNDPAVWWAKSGKKGGRLEERYRHEFGSLLELENHAGFVGLDPDMRELVWHVIATHHGRGRPHFPADEAFDPETPQSAADAVAGEVPRRFAVLQRKYGRWGLAYLESLLRAADYAASANPSDFVKGGSQ